MKEGKSSWIIISIIICIGIIMSSCTKPEPHSKGVVFTAEEISFTDITLSVGKPIGDMINKPFEIIIYPTIYKIYYPQYSCQIKVDNMGKEMGEDMEDDDVIGSVGIYFLNITKRSFGRKKIEKSQYGWAEFPDFKVSYDMTPDDLMDLFEEKGIEYEIYERENYISAILVKDYFQYRLGFVFTEDEQFKSVSYSVPGIGTPDSPFQKMKSGE